MQTISLSKILDSLESGGRPKGGAIDDPNGIPSLGAEHLNDSGSFNFSKIKYIPLGYFKSLKSGLIEKDNILIVKDGATTGKVSFVDEGFPFQKSAVNEHVFLLKVNSSKAYPRFVFQYLKTEQGIKEILSDFRGATVGGISRKFVELVKIPFPSLSDQLRISNILSEIEALIDKRKESINLLDEFLKSVFADFFGNLVRNSKRLKKVKLKEFIVHLTSGGRGWNKYYSEHGQRFIRSYDVQMNYISDVDAVFVNPPNNQEAKRTQIQPNDILLTITGSKIGRVTMVPFNFGSGYVSQHVAIIRVKNISQLYLSYYLADLNCGQLLISKNQYGQTKPGLNFKQIENFDILIPTLELQNQFARIVEGIEAQKVLHLKSLQELENLYANVSQMAFRGESVTLSKTHNVSLPIKSELEDKYFLKRKVLATYIINQSLNDSQFGDVKFEKLLHLSDFFAIKRNLNQNYLQKAAGPYDNAFTIPFFKQIETSKWFSRIKKGAQYVFKPDKKHGQSINTYGYFSDAELQSVNKLINYFKKSDYEQPEIISTLYAVWNNRILKQQTITDELLKGDFLNWDTQKIKYKDRLDSALKWMRKEGLVPDGWGKVIEKPKLKRNGK